MRRLTASSLQMMLAICSPAVLKLFDGELSVAQWLRLVSLTAAKGVNVWPGITSSQWISSLMTNTPFSAHILPISASSSGVHTLPAGLWGLQSRNTVVFSSAHFALKSSQSTT